MSGRWAAAVAGGLALCLGAWLLYATGEAPSVESATSSERLGASTAPRLPFGYQWPEGMVLDYDVELELTSGLDVGPKASLNLDGGLHLAGTLRLRVLTSGGQGLHVGLEFTELKTLSWRLMGEVVPEAKGREAYFDGREAVVVYRPDGRVEGLRFPPDTPRPYANIVETLVRQIQAPVAVGEARWTRTVDAAFGQVSTTYVVSGCEPTRCRIEMARDAASYTRFFQSQAGLAWDRGEGEGTQRFDVSKDGHLERCVTDERITMRRGAKAIAESSVSARLTLLRRGWETPRRSFVMDKGWLKARQLKDSRRENGLKMRVAGLTFERLKDDVLKYGNGGKVPDHKRWLWRATGLLRLHPELSSALGALFHDERLKGRAKSLVLDLLANVGHAEAQGVLREVLGDPAVRARTDYPALVQRYLLVRAPDDASLDFLEASYRAEGTDDARYASVTALGAALGRSVDRDPAGVRDRLVGLRDDLNEAEDPTAQRALVGALGGAGQVEFVDDIIEYTRGGETAVRSAAAVALRTMDSPEATDRLIEMVSTDRDPIVQGSSLRALAQHEPSTAQMADLAAGIEGAPLAAQNQRRFLQLLKKMAQTASAAEVLAVALAFQRHGIANRALAHELNELVLRLRNGTGAR